MLSPQPDGRGAGRRGRCRPAFQPLQKSSIRRELLITGCVDSHLSTIRKPTYRSDGAGVIV